MAERRMGVILLLLCLCLSLMPSFALTASTADAKEPILVENECVLTINYRADGTPLAQIPVNLYRIADVSADFQYTLLSDFTASGLVLNGIQTVGEWNVVRATLESHILAHNIEADHSAATDQNGQVQFDQLTPGLYFADAVTAVLNDATYSFGSALIALPGLDEDGTWQYTTAVNAKPQVLPPIDSDGQIELKVLKLWKGNAARPTSIEVEIFRDKVSQEIVVLSKENNWTYTWIAENDGAVWTVVERNVPAGYTASIEKRETAFILTNTPDEQPPSDSPQTGDTSHILLYTVLMYASGILLILLGITGKRKRDEKAK